MESNLEGKRINRSGNADRNCRVMLFLSFIFIHILLCIMLSMLVLSYIGNTRVEHTKGHVGVTGGQESHGHSVGGCGGVVGAVISGGHNVV